MNDICTPESWVVAEFSSPTILEYFLNLTIPEEENRTPTERIGFIYTTEILNNWSLEIHGQEGMRN